MDVICVKCETVQPESGLSISGPVKEIDENGRCVRRWMGVCPFCFSDQLRFVYPRKAS